MFYRPCDPTAVENLDLQLGSLEYGRETQAGKKIPHQIGHFDISGSKNQKHFGPHHGHGKKTGHKHHRGGHRHLSHNNKKNNKNYSGQSGLLPWQCKFEQEWRELPEGFYPRYISDGRCASERKTCMFDQYQCEAQKSHVKVMKRVTESCHPVPSLTSQTVFEEAWVMTSVEVTVACNCGAKINSPKSIFF